MRRLRTIQRMSGAALLLATVMLYGQESTGELRLEVKDPSGSPMEASGKLESLAAGVDRGFRTDAQGRYTFDGLATGRYRLEVSSPGFATHTSLIDLPSEVPVLHPVAMSLAPAPSSAVTVVGTTPLSRVDLPLEEISAPVQTATHDDVQNSGALDLSDFLNRRLNGVFLNEVQGNPVQPDLNYRGYTA